MIHMNQFINQFSLGESRSLVGLSYGNILLPEQPCDERINEKENRIPKMNWKPLYSSLATTANSLEKEKMEGSRVIVIFLFFDHYIEYCFTA